MSKCAIFAVLAASAVILAAAPGADAAPAQTAGDPSLFVHGEAPENSTLSASSPAGSPPLYKQCDSRSVAAADACSTVTSVLRTLLSS